MESTLPPKYPAIDPHKTPIVRATNVARKPTNKETRLPYNILVKRSLPNTSVPNIYSDEGGAAPKKRFCSA